MRARVIVMEPDDYEAWLALAKAEVARQPKPGPAAPAGRAAPRRRPPAEAATVPAQP